MRRTYREIFIDTLKAEAGTAGSLVSNGALRKQLQWDEERYQEVKDQLIVGHGHLAETVAQLDGFSDRLHGGLFELRFGEFGPEYASGAFHARLHFPKPGRLHITSRQESEYREFAKKTVASCAILYLQSEPVLLDRFVAELKGVSSRARDDAWLEAV